jgi:hypothetical protein
MTIGVECPRFLRSYKNALCVRYVLRGANRSISTSMGIGTAPQIVRKIADR